MLWLNALRHDDDDDDDGITSNNCRKLAVKTKIDSGGSSVEAGKQEW